MFPMGKSQANINHNKVILKLGLAYKNRSNFTSLKHLFAEKNPHNKKIPFTNPNFK